MLATTPAAQPGAPGTAPLPVCAVIVSYNRAEELRRCLASLHRQRPALARVVVVDNGSTDASLAMLRAEFPWVELIAAGANLGPCIARNIGAARAREPLLWFLDSDTTVPEAHGAARLHALFAADAELAAAGGEALVDTAGRSIGVKRLRCGASGIIQGDRITGSMPVTAECPVIASCNLMLRARDFARVGGFDPYYFFFYEDMDLTWRLHALGCRQVVLSPMPVLHHYSENVRIKRVWQHARNRMYFCLKHLPWQRLALMPLIDLGFVFQLDNLRRLRTRARQADAAASAIAATPAEAAPSGSTLRRALALLGKMAAIVTLGYAALPVVLGPALRARRALRQPAATPAGWDAAALPTIVP